MDKEACVKTTNAISFILKKTKEIVEYVIYLRDNEETKEEKNEPKI